MNLELFLHDFVAFLTFSLLLTSVSFGWVMTTPKNNNAWLLMYKDGHGHVCGILRLCQLPCFGECVYNANRIFLGFIYVNYHLLYFIFYILCTCILLRFLDGWIVARFLYLVCVEQCTVYFPFKVITCLSRRISIWLLQYIGACFHFASPLCNEPTHSLPVPASGLVSTSSQPKISYSSVNTASDT